MKRLLIVCITLLSLTAQAQSDSTENTKAYKLGLQFGTSVNSLSTRFILNPLISYSNYKHQFELGPKVFTGTWNTPGLRFGIEGNYKFSPNSKTTAFSSYLLVNNNYFYQNSNWTYNNYSILNEVHEVTRNSISHQLSTHLGYGIQWRFLSELYISTDVGLGFFYTNSRNTWTSSEPSLNRNSHNSYFDISFRTSLSLGWTF